jgi:hypothetical protein
MFLLDAAFLSGRSGDSFFGRDVLGIEDIARSGREGLATDGMGAWSKDVTSARWFFPMPTSRSI